MRPDRTAIAALTKLMIFLTFAISCYGYVSAQEGNSGINEKEFKKLARKGPANQDNPLYIVDGIEFKNIANIPHGHIRNITVYAPGDKETAAYGDKARYGVLEVRSGNAADGGQAIKGMPENSGPIFRGGNPDTFRMWLQANLRYPPYAHNKGIDGGILMKLTVNEAGIVTKIETIDSDSKLFEQYMLTLLKTAPNWLPAIKDGLVIKYEHTFPVEFRLSNKEYSRQRYPGYDNAVICMGYVF